MVNYRKGEVGFVNYNLERGDNYTGVKFTRKGQTEFLLRGMIRPNDADFEKIKNILGAKK